MNKMYTVKEVSELTGYKETYIRRMLSEGKLKRTKLKTGGVRVTEKDLKDWIGE